MSEGRNGAPAGDTPFEFRSNPRTRKVQYQAGRAGDAQVVVGYRRCIEYDDQGEYAIGQDDCYVWADGRRTIGVVADGVSQSFFGHLAAEWITDAIREFLDAEDHRFPAHEELLRALDARRSALEQRVEGVALPPTLAPLLLGSLEKKRVEVGSLVVFVAVIMDMETRRMKLYAVGDATATVFLPNAEIWSYPASIAPKGQSELKASRYSSRVGLKGRCYEREFATVEGLLLASDGLAIDVKARADLDMLFDQSRFEGNAEEFARKDDVSFVFFESAHSSKEVVEGPLVLPGGELPVEGRRRARPPPPSPAPASGEGDRGSPPSPGTGTDQGRHRHTARSAPHTQPDAREPSTDDEVVGHSAGPDLPRERPMDSPRERSVHSRPRRPKVAWFVGGGGLILGVATGILLRGSSRWTDNADAGTVTPPHHTPPIVDSGQSPLLIAYADGGPPLDQATAPIVDSGQSPLWIAYADGGPPLDQTIAPIVDSGESPLLIGHSDGGASLDRIDAHGPTTLNENRSHSTHQDQGEDREWRQIQDEVQSCFRPLCREYAALLAGISRCRDSSAAVRAVAEAVAVSWTEIPMSTAVSGCRPTRRIGGNRDVVFYHHLYCDLLLPAMRAVRSECSSAAGQSPDGGSTASGSSMDGGSGGDVPPTTSERRAEPVQTDRPARVDAPRDARTASPEDAVIGQGRLPEFPSPTNGHDP